MHQPLLVYRAAQLAPSPFLASVAGCSELITQILPPWLHTDLPNPSTESALVIWRQGQEEFSPSGTASHRQKAWDVPQIQAGA